MTEEILIKKVRKRDGRLVDFDFRKISEAIFKAMRACGKDNRELADYLAREVVELAASKSKVPNVEEIQDYVEDILMKRGYIDVAKSYILYRNEHKKLRDTTKLLIDSQQVIRDYISQEDWRVYENANINYSFGGLLFHSAGTILAYHGLNSIYPKEIGEAHVAGDFHIHNLSMSLAGYCAGWNLKQLLVEGFGGVAHRVESGPAKHLRTAVGQMINFIGTLQNEWAGAQAFNSFDTYLAPFVRYDSLNYEQVKQCIQEFIFNMNVTSRWGGQSPFSNITLDLTVPKDLRDQQVIVGGKPQKETYSDFQTEMDMINKAFIEVMTGGDYKGRVFTWPIPTYNITKDFDWNSEISEKLFEMTAKYGLPNFQNFINSDLNPSDIRAMCCRLQLNLKELMRNTTGGRFGSSDNTGSIGVVTINMPRIGYMSKSEEKFFEKLDQAMYLAMRSLEIKRKIVNNNLEQWLLPFTKRYLGNLDHHFSTIGLIGMNEACLNFLGQDIASKEGHAFSIKVLQFMREKLKEYQETTGHIYNLEATPGEGASYRLAKKDRQRFPDIKTSGNENSYYTNSTQLPVSHTNDLAMALKHQEPLQNMYTGGTIFHTFLGESLETNQAKLLVKKICTNFRIPYLTLTPTFSVCQNHGYLKGKQEACPTCNKSTEVYSRVVGYLRPVKNWNIGKQQEFKDRQLFEISPMMAD